MARGGYGLVPGRAQLLAGVDETSTSTLEASCPTSCCCMAELAADKRNSAGGGTGEERPGCSSAGILHCPSIQVCWAGSRLECEARSAAVRTWSAWTTRHAEPATEAESEVATTRFVEAAEAL